MSDKFRVDVEVFHRDEISLDPANQVKLGYAIYHWAILIRPKDFRSIDACTSFDATNGVRLDPIRRIDVNKDNDWYFRVSYRVNPLASGRFLGAVTIGKLPKNVTAQQVEAVLSTVDLPRKGQSPEEDCSSWIMSALDALQKEGFTEAISAEEIMASAKALGDEVMRDGPPPKIEDRFRNLTTRKM